MREKNGDIWIAISSEGLFKLSIDDGTYTKYGKDDGLPSNIFCFRSIYKDRSGRIYIGYVGGLVSFYPEDMTIDNNPPKVLVNNFNLLESKILFDEPIENIKEVVLSHSENSFEIDFVALQYDYPEYNQYAYTLDGFDKKWTYCSAKESFTRYTNIPPGEYTFRVKASNSDGVWNEEGASLKIIINPPFWQEWWFILLIIMTSIALIFSAIRLRTYTLQNIHKIWSISLKKELINWCTSPSNWKMNY